MARLRPIIFRACFIGSEHLSRLTGGQPEGMIREVLREERVRIGFPDLPLLLRGPPVALEGGEVFARHQPLLGVRQEPCHEEGVDGLQPALLRQRGRLGGPGELRRGLRRGLRPRFGVTRGSQGPGVM